MKKVYSILMLLFVYSASLAQYGATGCMGAQTVTMRFTGTPTITGTAGVVGSTYKYTNVLVGAGVTQQIDATFTLVAFDTAGQGSSFSGLNYDVPSSTAGIENNFQPSIITRGVSAVSAYGTYDIYDTWKVKFTLAGTSTPAYVPLVLQVVDNDGGSTSRVVAGGVQKVDILESVYFLNKPGSVKSSPNGATASYQTIYGDSVVMSTTINQAGVGTSPEYTAFASYGNTDSLYLKFSHRLTYSTTEAVPTPYSITAGSRYSSATFGCSFPGTNNFDLVSLSGNVYKDADGLTDGLVDGTGIGTASGIQLYANLLSADGRTVLASVAVGASGSYSFSVGANANYTVQLSRNAGTVGSAAPATLLPTFWLNNGESNNGLGTSSDGTPNGLTLVTVGAVNISNINFGIMAPDTDGDGVVDVDDLDDDNDGILDATECNSVERVVNGNFASLSTPSGNKTPSNISTLTSGAWTLTNSSTGASSGGVMYLNSGNVIQFFDEHPTLTFTQELFQNVVNVKYTGDGSFPQIIITNFLPSNGIGGSDPAKFAQKADFIVLYNSVEYARVTTTDGTGTGASVTYSNGATSSISTMAVGTTVGTWVITLPTTVPNSGIITLRYVAQPTTTGSGDDFAFRSVSLSSCRDTDGDDIPDKFDTDSDNDGCPDAIEGGGSIGYSNIGSSGQITGSVDVNGIPFATTGGQSAGSSADASVKSLECSPCHPTNPAFIDTDSDGIGDECDADDDNDGILDIHEKGETCGVNFNMADPTPTVFVNHGLFTSFTTEITGTTSTETFAGVTGLELGLSASLKTEFTPAIHNLQIRVGDLDYNEWIKINFFDENNVKIPTLVSFVTSVVGGKIQFYSDANFGLIIDADRIDGVGTTLSDRIEFKIPYRVSRMEITSSNPGRESTSVLGTSEIYLLGACKYRDTDSDGIPDYFDTDSDNDGCPDAVEGGASFRRLNLNANGSLLGSVDANGIPVIAGASGQSAGTSANAALKDAAGFCSEPPIANNITAPSMNNSQGATAIPQLVASSPTGVLIASYTVTSLPPSTEGVLYYCTSATVPCPSGSLSAVTTSTALTPTQAQSLYFDPAPGFTGNATFSYTAKDANDMVSNTANYIIPIKNDPPVTANIVTAQMLDTNHSTPLPSLIGADKDGTIVSYTVSNIPPSSQGVLTYCSSADEPCTGTVTTITGTTTLTPAQMATLKLDPTLGFTGNYIFNYTATDNDGNVSNVSSLTTPVVSAIGGNLPPVANNITAQNISNASGATAIPKLLGADPDGTVAEYTIGATVPNPATEGMLTYCSTPPTGCGTPVVAGQTMSPAQAATLSFDPVASFVGNAVFTYIATDDAGVPLSSVPATYTIPVVNTPPVANPDKVSPIVNTLTTPTLLPPLTGSDVEGPIATYNITSVPPSTQGTLKYCATAPGTPCTPATLTTISGPVSGLTAAQVATLNFIPNSGFTGDYVFNFSTVDSNGAVSQPATFTIPVTATASTLGQPPIAYSYNARPINSSGTANLSSALTGTDPDGTISKYTITSIVPANEGILTYCVAPPSTGCGTPLTAGLDLTPAQAATVLFTPNINFTGTSTFTYTATDNQGNLSNTATVTIPVINQPPVAQNVNNAALSRSASATALSPLSSTDPDGTVVSYTIQTIPTADQGVLRVCTAAPVTGCTPVTAGQLLTPAQMAQLSFTPNPSTTSPVVNFIYSTTDNAGNLSNLATVGIPMTDALPLPIELLGFTANNVDCRVQLEWSTGVEKDVAYFRILHSNGSQKSNIITVVPAKGSYSSYQYLHHQLPDGANIYRLEIVYTDQASVFTRSIICRKNCNDLLKPTISPNPASDVVSVQGLLNDISYTIRILDMQGKLLKQQAARSGDATVNISELLPASYLLQIWRDDELVKAFELSKQ